MRFYHRLIRTLRLPGNAAPGTPQLVLGPDVPADLAAHFAPNPVTACMLSYDGAGGYSFTVWLKNLSNSTTYIAAGWYSAAGGFVDGFLQQLVPTVPATPDPYYDFQGNSSRPGDDGLAGRVSFTNVDLQYHYIGGSFVSMPRGNAFFFSSSADSASAGVGATNIYTGLPPLTMVKNRVYRVVLTGAYSTSTATNHMKAQIFITGFGFLGSAAFCTPQIGTAAQIWTTVSYVGRSSATTTYSGANSISAITDAGTAKMLGTVSPFQAYIDDVGTLASFPGVPAF